MANQTVLQLAQRFCREYGLAVPTALQGSTDAGALQFRAVLQMVGDNIRGKTNWQQCSRRVEWPSVLGTDQGDIGSLFPDNFSHVVTDTMWDVTQRLPLIGPLTDPEWQTALGLASSRPSYSFRFAGGRLEVNPSMPADHTLSAIYMSRSWITSGASSVTTYLTDDDTSYFSDELMLAGLRAFWLRIKQMPHKLELDMYEEMKANEAGRNTVQRVLYQDAGGNMQRAGVLIPIGNWTLP